MLKCIYNGARIEEYLCHTFRVQFIVSPADKLSALKEISSSVDLLFVTLFFTMCLSVRTCEVTFLLKKAKFVQNYSEKKTMAGKEKRRKDRSETGGRKSVCLSARC